MTNNESTRLKDLLNMDLDDSAEADALLPLMMQLDDAHLPPISESATIDLIHQLSADLPATHLESPRQEKKIRWMLLLLRSQIRVVQKEIWIASLLVMLLGTLVTLITFDPASGNLTPLAVIAPVIAAIGVGLLYDDDMALIRELEDTTMTSTPMLLFARLMLVFCFDLVLATLGSIVLAGVETQLSLVPVIMSWLAPMTFLSALAFFVSVLSAQAIAGGMISFALWALHIFMQATASHSLAIQILSLQGLGALVTRPYLFIVAGLLVTVTLWFLHTQDYSDRALIR